LDPVTAGIVGFVVTFILIFFGMPIACTFMLVGFLGIIYLTSWGAALPVAASTIYHVAAHYPYTLIPLFVIMGGFASSGGLVRELYGAFDKWFRRVPGGLAVTTIGACAGFAAVSGSSVASAAAMGTIALPEMKRFKYSPRLATGTVAAGGTLAFLIPPSIGFVIYGMLTEQSIGKLLISGVFPGFALAVAYAAIVIFSVKLNPGLAPISPEAVSWKEKLLALRSVRETMATFVLVLGGIFVGWFTPTEAGAIGATTLCLIVLLKKKLTWSSLVTSLREAVRVSAMVLFLVAGATVFSYFLALSGIPMHVATWIGGLEVSRYFILSLILLIYLFLGCFIDAVSMMVLTLPVIFPVIVGLGFDPIWFGVIAVLMMNAGLITPPMGLNVYTVAGIAKDVPVEEIYRGALPFFIAIITIAILVTIFPQMALFLPGQMFP
jgi:tripartite ATP-independent transporter DctM subunit